MATSKKLPSTNPRTPSPRKAPSGLISIPEGESVKTYKYYKVAFIGRTGSGRNSLAWRMNNLDDSELPFLQPCPLREAIVDTATRPTVRSVGTIGLRIRMVPPEEYGGERFFERTGEMHDCHAFVFVVDLGDENSYDEFYRLHRKVMRHSKPGMPRFLIVGTKADQKNAELAELHGFAGSAERLYSARGYLECSAKTSDGVGDVLDAVLGIVLRS